MDTAAACPSPSLDHEPAILVAAESFHPAANSTDYAYRDTEDHEGSTTLVLFQHFRGNLDYWDPALVDALAQSRRVIAFDNAGVGNSTGTTPDTVDQMARDAIAFISALGLSQVDMLGFSIGSFVAQEVALRRPGLVRRLVLASSAPKGSPHTYGSAVSAVGSGATAESSAEGYLRAFFAPTETSQQAGKEVLGRLFTTRTEDRDANTNLATVEAQFEAARVWSMPDHSALERVQALEMPVFTANGANDQMILTHNTYLLAGLIPQAQVKIYPDSGHGFLFQHHAEFAADVEAFLLN